MLAFQDTKVTKPQIIAQLKAHEKADEFVKGLYWEGGKGCAVGCTIHSGDHEEYEIRFGIPQALARLEDTIFEGLENSLAKKWPLRFMSAIKPKSDLSLVQWKFLLWLQKENLKSAKKNKMPQDVVDCIAKVILVLNAPAKGKPVDKEAAWSAESAAWSAESAAESAESAAESAARSAAWSARSAAWSAESAAESARSAAESARSAAESAESAAESAAIEKSYSKMADKLIELIKDAS